MTFMRHLLYICPLLLIGACASVRPVATPLAVAKLEAADGTDAGTATLTRSKDKLTLTVNAASMPVGQHGIHLHAVGTCEPPSFKSAGSHLNPFGKMHGSLNPQGSHLGDLPNLVIGADGMGALSVKLSGTASELEPLIFDADSTALVIHETADDYRTDPSGKSGSRIACGVLIKQDRDTLVKLP